MLDSKNNFSNNISNTSSSIEAAVLQPSES